MKAQRIVLCGANGFLGSALVAALKARGAQISVIGRSVERMKTALPGLNHYAELSDRAQCLKLVQDAEAVVNLAGASVGELRWTEENKALMRSSRIDSTRLLTDLLKEVAGPTRSFISASAIGFYGFGNDEWKTETDHAGSDFLAQLCDEWERESQLASDVARVLNPRIGVVLDAHSGALAKLLLPYRLFLGGPLGDGQQWMSWIHRDDMIAALIFCIDHPTLQGPVNCVAPQPVRMDEFAECVAKALHRPNLFRVPELTLRMILGEQHSIVTRGQRVSAELLVQNGFEFQFSSCKESVNSLLGAR